MIRDRLSTALLSDETAMMAVGGLGFDERSKGGDVFKISIVGLKSLGPTERLCSQSGGG